MTEALSGNRKIKRARTCVACGKESEKRELLRVVRTPEGVVKYDVTGKANGRGAYVCSSSACIKKARIKNLFARALKAEAEDALYEELNSAHYEATR